MNYTYASSLDEKFALEKAKRYVGLAALPFAISGGVFVKALQTSNSLVSYLCDIDSSFSLSDKLFEFKGPVIISDVYLKSYKIGHSKMKGEKGFGVSVKLIPLMTQTPIIVNVIL